MKAFTTSTADYRSLSVDAAERAERHLGLKVAIVECSSKAEVFRKRVSAFLDFSEPVWHLDSDLWILSDRTLPTPSEGLFFAAPCDGMEKAYMKTPVPPASAFDTCLIGFDMADNRVRASLERVLKKVEGNLQEATKLLNLEFHSQPWAFPARMSNVWNWCGTPNHLTVGLHAAFRPEKEQWLKTMTQYHD